MIMNKGDAWYIEKSLLALQIQIIFHSDVQINIMELG